jgi:hypothetical protein
VRYLATLIGAKDDDVLRHFITRCRAAPRPGRHALALGGDTDTVLSARRRAGRPRSAPSPSGTLGSRPAGKAHRRGSLAGICGHPAATGQHTDAAAVSAMASGSRHSKKNGPT